MNVIRTKPPPIVAMLTMVMMDILQSHTFTKVMVVEKPKGGFTGIFWVFGTVMWTVKSMDLVSLCTTGFDLHTIRLSAFSGTHVLKSNIHTESARYM